MKIRDIMMQELEENENNMNKTKPLIYSKNEPELKEKVMIIM